MELTKHQVKIAELKQQVSKLTSKCHVWSIAHSSPHEEGTCDHWHEGPGVSTSLVFDLADKLAEQVCFCFFFGGFGYWHNVEVPMSQILCVSSTL
jgi:hypothetical protein